MTRYTNAHLLRHLVLKMHHVTKAGSGQSKGKLKKRCVFLQFRTAMSRLGLGLSEQQVVQCDEHDVTVSIASNSLGFVFGGYVSIL